MKIIQISTIVEKLFNRDSVEEVTAIYGLGEDGKVYLWDIEHNEWVPYVSYGG